MHSHLRHFPITLILLTLLSWSAFSLEENATLFANTPWHDSLVRDGGGWWSARIPLTISNRTKEPVLGKPLFLRVGSTKDALPIVGAQAELLRVCDASGNEMLYHLVDKNGQTIVKGPIAEGGELSIPVECEAEATCLYYVYFNNPHAQRSPEFLSTKGRLANGDLEAGSQGVPFGWQNDSGDQEHQAKWSTETSHSGQHSLKTIVAEGAQPTWIATRQTGIHIEEGARYEFRAWVKGETVKGTAGWYLHIGNAKKSQMLGRMATTDEETFDWKEVTTQFTVPAGADRLNLGTVLRGTGTAWFDDASLTMLEPPKEPALTAEVEPIERIELRKIGNDAWAAPITLPGYDYRLVLEAINTSDTDQKKALLQVNINSLVARYGRLLNLDAVQIQCDGKPVQFYRLSNSLLINDSLPARSVKCYQLYFTTDSEAKPEPGTDYAALVASRFNLLKNGSFEEEVPGKEGKPIPASWDGAKEVKAPIAMEQTKEAAPGLGRFAARLNVPQGQPAGWRGWKQWVDLQSDTKTPNDIGNARTYFYSGYLRSHHLRKVEKVDSDAFDPQAEASLDYARLHVHFHDKEKAPSKEDWSQSIGQQVTDDSNEWKLLQGNLTAPNDAAFIGVHLTMDGTGDLLHDGVFLGRVVPITASPHLDRRLINHNPAFTATWPVNAIQKVFADDFLPAKTTPAKISLARNEKEPLQIAVRSTLAMDGVRVVVDPPVGPNGATLDDIDVGVVGYVPVDYPTGYYHTRTDRWRVKYPNTPPICDGWPGLWPDPIVPTDLLNLKPGKTQPVWITFGANESTPPGTYRGTVRLIASGKKIVAELPFEVHVWNFTLPKESHVKAIYDIRTGPAGAQIWGEKDFQGVYEKLLPFMAERRLCSDKVNPRPKIEWKDGRVVADFTEFDKAAKRYFDELGMKHSYTPWDFYLFGWGHRPGKKFGEAPYPGEYPYEGADWSKLRPEYKQRYQACLKVFWDHITEKGWADRFVLYISDEPFYTKENILTQMKALCDMIHEVNPNIPIYSSTWHYVPGWKESLDIWGISHFGYVSPERIAKIQKDGSKVWFTTDGQMCLDTPYCAVERLLPHYCFKYGAEAYEFWGVSWLTYNPFEFGMHSYIHQTMSPEEWYWVRYPNGDGYLIYPGTPLGIDGPISTIRLEQAREGVEDYEYLYLLRQLIQEKGPTQPATAKSREVLREATQLVKIPNAGGRYSSKILPNPDAVFEIKQKVAQAIEDLQAKEK